MYSIRVNSDLAALVHRTASYCGVEFGTIIRRAARDKLCKTLPVIQVENSELYHAGKMEHFLTTRNPGRAREVPDKELREAIVIICFYCLSIPRRRKFTTSLVEGVDYIVVR